MKTGVHPGGDDICAGELDKKLLEVRLNLHRSREELALFHPDLYAIENMVRSSMIIDPYGRAEEQRPTCCHWNYSKPTTTNITGTANTTTSSSTTTTTSLPSVCAQENEIVSSARSQKRLSDDEWELIVSKAAESLKSCLLLEDEQSKRESSSRILEPVVKSGNSQCLSNIDSLDRLVQM